MADFWHQTYKIISSSITYRLELLAYYFPCAAISFATKLIPYCFLGSICYVLDVIFLTVKHRCPHVLVPALVDNSAHGVIAFISWCVVSEVRARKDFADGAVCALIACALDVDHFIAARSLQLKV